MSTLFIGVASLAMLALSFSARQTMNMEDMTIGIAHQKDFNEIRKFLDARGFDYDTMMLPGNSGKTYNFTSTHSYRVQTSAGDFLQINDIALVRMDTDVKAGKFTLMTPSREYYEELVAELSEKKFLAKEHTDKSKPLSYTSTQVPGVAVSLSTAQAVKEGKVYNRYTVSVNY